MRKSNWLVVGILVVASFAFLALWYTLGFNQSDNPLDLVLSIVWWVVIVAVCIAIKLAEIKRRRSIRTSFIAPGLIYNPELGIVRLRGDQDYTTALERILSSLSYGFDNTSLSNDRRIRFTYVVHSDRFSHNGAVWRGEVLKVSNPENIYPFSNRSELAHLIDEG